MVYSVPIFWYETPFFMHALDLSKRCAIPVVAEAPFLGHVCTDRHSGGSFPRPQVHSARSGSFHFVKFKSLSAACSTMPCCSGCGLLGRRVTIRRILEDRGLSGRVGCCFLYRDQKRQDAKCCEHRLLVEIKLEGRSRWQDHVFCKAWKEPRVHLWRTEA